MGVSVQKVARGIFWVEIPEADLRILCGCPADSVKHLVVAGLVRSVQKNGVRFETGPNAILLSDASIQNGAVANLAEFPVLQMLYRQGMMIPGHPNNTGRKPLLLGIGDQVRSQAAYLFRGTYGLTSREELEAAGASPAEAEEMLRVKAWFAFGRIQETHELVELRALDGDAVTLAPGVVVHRRGYNRYEFIASGGSVEVDLTLGPGEFYGPPFSLAQGSVSRDRFSVVHLGEGDGWDPGRPCMGSLVCCDGLLYLVDAGPNVTQSLAALGLGVADIEGIFHTHAHDDHFAGLATLARSERRLRYYAAPWVRASVRKKLAALMHAQEPDLHRFFEVHDLVPGQWNQVGGMQVRPVYSPHPVETTVFFFRSGEGPDQRIYAHLADIASRTVLARLGAAQPPGPALSAVSLARIQDELAAFADLKKVDAGGGMIHGDAADFAGDCSGRLVLSHGVAQTAATPRFGDVDVLLPAAPGEDRQRPRARALLSETFPLLSARERDLLTAGPVRPFRAGQLISMEAADGALLVLEGAACLDGAGSAAGAARPRRAGALLEHRDLGVAMRASARCRSWPSRAWHGTITAGACSPRRCGHGRITGSC
jgi:hemerythrin